MTDDPVTTTRLAVAVYWPMDGEYGIPKTVENDAGARMVAEQFYREGYGRGKSEIHIIRTIKTIAKWELA